ncbi:MarR family winged helix-turn-helix transcriptional regulator [Salinibacterium sp. ZJ450]|uniref:MarR family winged helix-turn-helix transcriptional regulator n=1 Tax=Salinibacterium sp. ZJ450 TaxID=2708338 RepID=UPI00351D3F7C
MSDRSIAVDAWEALFRAQVTVLRELNSVFPNDQLSLNEYDVLFNLSRQPGWRLRIRDLNKHILLTQPSVSRLIDRLASRDLVTKTPDPGDGRGTIVTLTDAGFDLFRTVAATHTRSITDRVGSALSNDELLTLTDLCNKLRLSED